MLIEEKEQIQLSLFEENLPTKPYCKDEKDGGMLIRSQAIAKLKRYIQHNQPTMIRWLVYDCDYWGVLDHIGQNHLPPPNLVVSNRKTGYAHVFYGLLAPVCTTETARRKPINLLAKIDYKLCDELEADKGYVGLISKNPLHTDWEVLEINPTPWELGDFLEYLELPEKLPKVSKLVGLGRNVTLFETARRWAYRQVLAFRLTGTQTAFHDAVLSHCQAINQTFVSPLGLPEVKATAKSIAKWTWAKYTGQLTDEEFSQKQAYRATKGKGVARYRHSAEDRAKAVLMVSEGATQAEVAKVFGVSRETVNKWCASAAKS